MQQIQTKEANKYFLHSNGSCLHATLDLPQQFKSCLGGPLGTLLGHAPGKFLAIDANQISRSVGGK